MIPTLHIQLFNDFSLTYNDQLVTSLTTTRLQSLLAYLVLHRDVPQKRQHLAFLFWPDTTEAQARNNLRQLVHQLRQTLPIIEYFLHIDASTLHWRLDRHFSLDVAEFEGALSRAGEADRRQEQRSLQVALEQVDSLYRGELLPGCYDEWVLAERERLRQSHMQALEQLVRLLETQGDIVAAIRYTQRLIRCDPLSEASYRHLMRLFALNNDRASAVRVYHSCAATLQRELGVEPDPATRETYEQLLHLEAPTTRAVERQPVFATPSTLIGRKSEWEELQHAWRNVISGNPHFVLVTGEAGIGKSRLAEDFLAWAGQQGSITAKARSYAAEGQLSLAPVTAWLRSLRPHINRLDQVWLTEVARILPELLAERPDIPRYEPVTEYGQRQRFFEALARAILVLPQPLLLLIDDMQWCDPETLEWLHFLLRFNPEARLLIIGCARAEELPPQHPLRILLLHLHNTMGVTEIALQPFDVAETAQLAEQMANRELDLASLMHLYNETGGYPLFVVEIVRAGLGRVSTGLQKADSLHQQSLVQAIPPRMHAVLAGRLRQVSPSSRELVELAAIIGYEFSLDLLIAASNTPIDDAVRALDELWHKRIIREHGANSYDFTHDKLREVAYAEISAPQRRMLHHRVAKALEAMHAENLDPVCRKIAWHYERAGMIEQTCHYYQHAAIVGQHVYANEEAINLLIRSLELLKQLPASPKRDRQEFNLQLALAPLYRMTRGWAAPELERVLKRALALCDIVGDDTQRVQALYGVQSLYVVQAKLEEVHIISDNLHMLYEQLPGAVPPFAGVMMAGAQLHLGKITEANEHFAHIIETHDPDQLHHLQESQGANYAALALVWQAHALWCLGYPQQALHRGKEAVRLVQNLDQPFNQALVSAYMALLQQLCAGEESARTYAEEALALTSKYQAPYYQAWAAILVSYAQALSQPDEVHIGHLRKTISEFKATSSRLRLPYFLSLLARASGKAGRVREGLAFIDEALYEAHIHNEGWWNAELYRLRGELLFAQGGERTEIEGVFLQAIEIAQAQRARSLELRATMSLVHFWDTQDRFEDGRQILNDLYSWFTEGFDTPDLQAARRLLAQSIPLYNA